VGVDGCSSGWFAVQLSDKETFEANLYSDISTLWNEYHDNSLILIDIPIGLREEGKTERLCDLEARRLLGKKRGCSVFCTPCRQATSEAFYEQASAVNKKYTDKKLSKQSFAISHKIHEVDSLLSNQPLAKSKIMEIHPELCFHMFSGNSMFFSKKKSSGFDERIRVLRDIYADTDELVERALSQFRRKDVAKDDILDALVAALTAKFGYENGLHSIPTNPEIDSRGLPMRMIYSEP
jgi:predicted RNase H-like nuclease